MAIGGQFMQKVRIYLDYRCFPLWIYDDNGDFVDNDLPKELSEDKEVDDAFVEIQNVYDSLFLDNSTEFRYIGFSNEADKEKFIKMIDDAVNLITSKLGDSYIIEKEIDV
jgi:hypothetical protein